MSDDTEETEVEDIELSYDSDTESEYVEVEGAQIIAVGGWVKTAALFNSPVVRVLMAKGGTVEFLVRAGDSDTWHWHDPTKATNGGRIAAIKSDKH